MGLRELSNSEFCDFFFFFLVMIVNDEVIQKSPFYPKCSSSVSWTINRADKIWASL